MMTIIVKLWFSFCTQGQGEDEENCVWVMQ